LVYASSVAPPAAAPNPRPRLTRDDVLDAREVAALLHLPLSTALEFARRGVIPGHKLGRRWIFLRDEIEAGVRRASPTKPASPSTSQRPASKAGKSTSGYQKRYPMAVPDRESGPQPRLFG
jgi:excisionase family DNA binding protein